MADTTRSADVDAYIDSCPHAAQPSLQEIRRTIHEAVPDAGEKISYRIPTVTVDGKMLVYFAGWEQHVSVYPIPPADDALTAAMDPYIAGKGTLKFPLDQPIPYDLIALVAQAHLARLRGHA